MLQAQHSSKFVYLGELKASRLTLHAQICTQRDINYKINLRSHKKANTHKIVSLLASVISKI